MCEVMPGLLGLFIMEELHLLHLMQSVVLFGIKLNLIVALVKILEIMRIK